MTFRRFFVEFCEEIGITLPPRKVKKSNSTLLERRKNFNFSETWQVRWKSRNGNYSSDTKPEVAAFTSREEAEEFAAILRESFRLLRYTAGTVVEVSKGN